MSKIRQLKSAVEACISIMRIDTFIALDNEARGEDDGHGHWRAMTSDAVILRKDM
jgi:chaperonin GroEL (HSP60 family)